MYNINNLTTKYRLKKMKKYLSCLIITLSFNFTFSFLAMAEDAPLIANHQKAIGFGIWKIYNAEDLLVIVDEKERRFIPLDTTGNAFTFVIDRKP